MASHTEWTSHLLLGCLGHLPGMVTNYIDAWTKSCPKNQGFLIITSVRFSNMIISLVVWDINLKNNYSKLHMALVSCLYLNLSSNNSHWKKRWESWVPQLSKNCQFPAVLDILKNAWPWEAVVSKQFNPQLTMGCQWKGNILLEVSWRPNWWCLTKSKGNEIGLATRPGHTAVTSCQVRLIIINSLVISLPPPWW